MVGICKTFDYSASFKLRMALVKYLGFNMVF